MNIKAKWLLLLPLLLLCLVTVGIEGKKKKKEKNRQKEPTQVVPVKDEVNMCDLQDPEVIFCYCDELEFGKAEEGNCWIFNNMTAHPEKWESFSSQPNIKRLTLHLRPDGTLTSIPLVGIMHLPKIDTFEVQYASIPTISSYGFGNSTTLEVLSLARNGIGELESHAFAHLHSLTMVTLGENHITEVNRHVFVDLPNLKELYMDRNNITIVHDNAFQGLRKLEELELFNNQIQVITPDTFRGLVSLKRLDLHKNHLEVIGNNTFEGLKSLRTLDLQENSLKYLAPNGFKGLTKLNKLVLQDNKLLSLGPDVFKHTPSLYSLNIRSNVLETLTYQTVEPLFDNLKNHTMLFILEGNNFRCDTRLGWMFELQNVTTSYSVRTNLESLICYLEVGTLPARLEGQTVTPAYETTTLGIGPMTKLFDLHEHELPKPLAWMQTEEPDCEEENTDSNQAQNDMAPIQDRVHTEDGQSHSSMPVQSNNAAVIYSIHSAVLMSTVIFSLAIFFQWQPQ